MSNIGVGLQKLLDLLPVKVLLVVSLSFCFVVFCVQIIYTAAFAKHIRNDGRIKKFVYKYGDIDIASSHKFYKKCVSHMSCKVKKSWKKHLLTGKEYAGSDLQYNINTYLTKEKRPVLFYYYIAFSCVAGLQTLLLCKGLPWAHAVCYSAINAGAWMLIGLLAKLFNVVMARKNNKCAQNMLQVITDRLTLKNKPEQNIYLINSEPVKTVADTQTESQVPLIGQKVIAYVDSLPDKSVAKYVMSAVESIINNPELNKDEKDCLSSAIASLKKYTA